MEPPAGGAAGRDRRFDGPETAPPTLAPRLARPRWPRVGSEPWWCPRRWTRAGWRPSRAARATKAARGTRARRASRLLRPRDPSFRFDSLRTGADRAGSPTPHRHTRTRPSRSIARPRWVRRRMRCRRRSWVRTGLGLCKRRRRGERRAPADHTDSSRSSARTLTRARRRASYPAP